MYGLAVMLSISRFDYVPVKILMRLLGMYNFGLLPPCPVCSDGPVVLPFNEGGGVGEIPNRHSICHYRITQHSKALNTEVGSNILAAHLRAAVLRLL